MTVEALDIYRDHLREQLGESAPITETAILDPSGESEATLSGVFDESVFRGDKDGGNVAKKFTRPRFLVADAVDIDVYSDKQIYFPYRDRTFKIYEIDSDEAGGYVIWLA
jgi:hypothetical protein